MKKTDIAYVAGLVDADGYIGIKKAAAYKCQGRKTPGYHGRIQIRMVSEEAIAFISTLLGGWYYKEKPSAKKGRPLYCFQASDKSAEKILKTIVPFLKIKKESAKTVIALRNLQANGAKHRTKILGYRNFPNSHGTPRKVPNLVFSDEYVAQCESLYMQCKELNRVGV
jgi:hypothetical protein